MIYRYAVRRVAHATEHIRHCVQHDPSRAADAAWAAADVLYSAAQVISNGALRDAADAYDRAARAQFGRVPPRSSAGQRLRLAARTLAGFESPTAGASLALVALVDDLMALTAAVAELRLVQQHAAQAVAARATAEQLRAASAELRAEAARLGQAEPRRRARLRGAASLPRHEAVTPPLAGLSGSAQTGSVEANPQSCGRPSGTTYWQPRRRQGGHLRI